MGLGSYTEWDKVTVTANLHDALRAVLRARIGPIRLWVDAICINQNDYKDRSDQVRNKSQIYSQAAGVIAWVEQSEGRELSSNTTDELRNLPDWGKEATLSLSQLRSAALFFSEPYWRRVWIIQDITVASKVTILYSNCIFQWEHVVALLSRLRNMESTCRKDHYKTFMEAIYLWTSETNMPVHLGLDF